MATERELWLTIKAKNLTEAQFKQLGNSVDVLGKQVKEAGGSMTESMKDIDNKGIAQTLRGLSSLRFTIWRLRYVWILSVGAMVGAIINSAKKIEELNELAIRTGKPFEELAKKVYGVNLNLEQARDAIRLWTGLQQTIEGLTIAIGQGLYNAVEKTTKSFLNMTPAGKAGLEAILKSIPVIGQAYELLGKKLTHIGTVQIPSVSKEILQLQEQLTDDIKRNSLSRTDFEIYMLNKAYEVSKEKMLMKGGDLKLLEEWYKSSQSRIYFDYVEKANAMYEMSKATYVGMRNAFSDIIFDSFTGQVKTMSEYWKGFTNSLMRAWSNAVSNMITNWLLFGDATGQTKTGGVFGSIMNLVGVVTGTGTVTAGATAAASSKKSSGAGGGFQSGTSYVPHKGLYMLHAGEQVTPAGESKGKSGDNYFVQINAVDSRSFVDMLNKNPDAVVAIVNKDIMLNRSSRKVR